MLLYYAISHRFSSISFDMTLQGTLFVYLQSLLRFPFSHSLLTHSALFSTACVICDYLIS